MTNTSDSQIRQLQRLYDLYIMNNENGNMQSFAMSFVRPRVISGRTFSSLEEELSSGLLLFDDKEKEEITKRAEEIAKENSLEFNDQRVFQIAQMQEPEFGRKLKILGMVNFQGYLQGNFYKEASRAGLFALSDNYNFDAGYQKATVCDLSDLNFTCIETDRGIQDKKKEIRIGDNIKVAVLEEYKYARTDGYRSVLYHLLRHLTNLHGEESSDELKEKAREVFKGKKVLEIGCGPGFFLHTLRELGGDVTGIEENEQYREQTQNAGLEIIYGNAIDLSKLVSGDFDIVFSRDFFSLGVTKDYAYPLMQEAYKVLKEGGFSFHSIDYSKMTEERYIGLIREESQRKGVGLDHIIRNFCEMTAEQKEIILRRNILNLSPDSIEKIGFQNVTQLKLDFEENLSIASIKRGDSC